MDIVVYEETCCGLQVKPQVQVHKLRIKYYKFCHRCLCITVKAAIALSRELE